jgi:hypothetical protein
MSPAERCQVTSAIDAADGQSCRFCRSSLPTIGRMIAGKVMKAMIHISPPQRGQASGKAS